MRIERILLPTDFSETAEHAAKLAARLAVQHGARIDVFHAVTLDADDPMMLEKAMDEYLRDVGEDVLDELAKRSESLRRRGIPVQLSTSRSTSASDAILDKVDELRPDLVVMGTQGRTGLGKLVLGSVAETVVRHAPGHVLTVGKDARVSDSGDGFGRILVPVDFSPLSPRSIEVARSLLGSDGELVLHHVVSNPVLPSLYAGSFVRMFQVDPELPERIRDELSSLYDGPGEIIVTEGQVVEELLATVESRAVELIVMGTKGLSGLEHVLVGSVTERIVRLARAPVLSVK